MEDRMEQIDAMRMGVDYRFTCRVRQFEITLRPLSVFEVVRLTADVAEELKATPDKGRNSLTEHTLLAKKTLVLASTSDVGVNDPRITDYILERMTTDELHFLFKSYQRGCDGCNPALELMSADQVRDLVEVLKKSPLDREEWALALTELSLSQMISLIHHFLVTKSD